MRLTRRSALALSALPLVSLLGLTGCAPGPSPSDAASEASTPTTVDFSSFKGQSMTYVYFTDGPDEQGTRDAIARFEQETGAKVNLQIVPFADLNSSLQARLSAGNAPEVARVSDWHAYAEDVVDFHQYFGQEYSSEFTPETASTVVDAQGRMMAVPSDLTVNAPFVNVDAFTKAGVQVPEKWTWDELIADAKKVAAANGMPNAFAIDKSGNRLSTVLSQYGTVMVGKDGNALDEAKATQALTFFDGLAQDGTMPKDFWLGSGSKYTAASEIFLAQQVPVYLSGPWQVGAFAKNATFTWAAAPDPCAERCGGFPGGKYMVAYKDSPNPTLGAAFVQWMNRTENQKALDQTAFWLPTRADLTQSGIEYPQRGEDMSSFLATIGETPADTFTAASAPAFAGSATALITETDKLVSGQQDVAATVTNLSAAIDKAVQDAQ